MMMLTGFVLALLAITNAQNTANLACCIDHESKPTDGSAQAMFDCSILTVNGEQRCNAVWGGEVCKWATGDLCVPKPKPCQRVERFRAIGDEKVDVGYCTGDCEQGKGTCKPSKYATVTTQAGNEVQTIAECACDGCAAVEEYTTIEVPQGRCDGDCPDAVTEKTCRAGQADNFNPGNPEPASPTPALVAGFGSICSFGIHPGFDYYADNQCFAHSFIDCFKASSCPLQAAKLHICIQAANVPLTRTDSLILGVGGSSLWGRRMVDLSSNGRWDRGQKECFTFDLSALPTNAAPTSILADIEAAGNLDVVVQDDSAVDFIDLKLVFEDCQKCIPIHTHVNTLFTNRGIREFEDVQDCACVDASACSRQSHVKSFFVGTQFEQKVDVGLCVGGCDRYQKCHATKTSEKEIKTPSGLRTIKVIEACDCGRPRLTADGYLDFTPLP